MITIDQKKMMIEHYKEVIHVSQSEIVIRMGAYVLNITGEQLQIIAFSKHEVLVEGKLRGVQFTYDES